MTEPTRVFESEFKQICEKVYECFYRTGRCAFRVEGKRCQNTEAGHGSKGHQDREGNTLGKGDFQSPYNSTKRHEFVERISLLYRIRLEKVADEDRRRPKLGPRIVEEHKNTLAKEQQLWTSIFSNKTCLCCLMSHPDYVLPCGHAVCEKCVKIFGTNEPGDAHSFRLESCTLCHQSLSIDNKPWIISLKPPDAGLRILSLDGGGIRGVISVRILELLEAEIGLGIPIHQFFDMIIGTSTGKPHFTID